MAVLPDCCYVTGRCKWREPARVFQVLRLPAVVSLAISLFGSLLLAQSPASTERLRLAPLFGNHMVLPPSTSVVVHGHAAGSGDVKVSPSWGGEVSAQVGVDGRFHVAVMTPERGVAASLRVQCGDAEIVIEDVLIGDVWLASGQS